MVDREYEDIDRPEKKTLSDNANNADSKNQVKAESENNRTGNSEYEIVDIPAEKPSDDSSKQVGGSHYEDIDSIVPPNGSDSANNSRRRHTFNSSDSTHSKDSTSADAEKRLRSDTTPHEYAKMHKIPKKPERSNDIDTITEESVPPKVPNR